MKSGFTLVEIIVAVAILGILAAIGVMNYTTWHNSTLVTEAARQITQDIERTRSEAKRYNLSRQLYAAIGTSYELRDQSNSVISTRTLPRGIRIAQLRAVAASTTTPSSISLVFSGSYGTQGTTVQYYDIDLQNQNGGGITRTVRVIAPLGKVIVL